MVDVTTLALEWPCLESASPIELSPAVLEAPTFFSTLDLFYYDVHTFRNTGALKTPSSQRCLFLFLSATYLPYRFYYVPRRRERIETRVSMACCAPSVSRWRQNKLWVYFFFEVETARVCPSK